MERVWHKHYEKGVPTEIDAKKYASINEVTEQAFKKFADKESFYCMGKCFTWGEMDILTKKFASYLQNDLGLKKGDRFAMMMPNILQYPIALFGALRAGLIVVNVNPLYTARELEHQLNGQLIH